MCHTCRCQQLLLLFLLLLLLQFHLTQHLSLLTAVVAAVWPWRHTCRRQQSCSSCCCTDGFRRCWCCCYYDVYYSLTKTTTRDSVWRVDGTALPRSDLAVQRLFVCVTRAHGVHSTAEPSGGLVSAKSDSSNRSRRAKGKKCCLHCTVCNYKGGK